MPWDEVLHKWKAGALRSGGAGGPKVKNQKQAVAIMLSEKRKAATGNSDYKEDEHPFLKNELGSR